MPILETISKTELARRTRQVVDKARRGWTVIVKSYGEEQVAIMDALDYRLLRAVAASRGLLGPHAPAGKDDITPEGLSEKDVERAVEAAGGDIQVAWNKVVAAYLDGHISLQRAAELLGLPSLELAERFDRLGVPLLLGPVSAEEARAEGEALRASR